MKQCSLWLRMEHSKYGIERGSNWSDTSIHFFVAPELNQKADSVGEKSSKTPVNCHRHQGFPGLAPGGNASGRAVRRQWYKCADIHNSHEPFGQWGSREYKPGIKRQAFKRSMDWYGNGTGLRMGSYSNWAGRGNAACSSRRMAAILSP